jgi:hypothetical protein
MADASEDRRRREASGLAAAYLQWHLERQVRSLRLVERAYWDAAVKGLVSPATIPGAASFETLPAQWRMRDHLQVARPGPNRIVRFDAASGTEKWSLPASRAYDLTFDKDCKSIRFFGHIDSNEPNAGDGYAQTGKPLPRTMKAERGYSSAIHPDGKVLAVGGYFGHISQWDLQTRKQLDASADPSGLIADVHFNPDATKIRGFSRGWYEWDVQTGKQTRLTPPLDVVATTTSLQRAIRSGSPGRQDGPPHVHLGSASSRPPQLRDTLLSECLALPNGRLTVTMATANRSVTTSGVYQLATGRPDFICSSIEKTGSPRRMAVGDCHVGRDDHSNSKRELATSTPENPWAIGRSELDEEIVQLELQLNEYDTPR